MSYFNNQTYIITIPLYSYELGEDFEISVKVNYLQGEEQTYFEPVVPDEIEIIDIYDNDFPVNISYNNMWELIEEYEGNNYMKLLGEIKSASIRQEDDYAEYLYEQQKYDLL